VPEILITQTTARPKRARSIVIIGAGGIVRDAHLPAYAKAGFPVAGLFDRDCSRSQVLASQFEIPRVYESLDEAVRETPAETVFDVAVPASVILEILPRLPDGCGVLIQKPLGENLEQAAAIRAVCRQKQLTAAVNFQLRFAPLALAARSLIEQGLIGELHEIEFRVTVYTPWHLWTFLEGLARVEILYHSIHYLDLIRAFLGEPCGVHALTLKHPKAPKLASTRSTLLLNYGDTVRAQVSTNHGHEYGSRHQESFVKWEGTQGAIKATLGVLLNYPKGEADRLEYCLLAPDAEPQWLNLPLEGNWFPDAFIGSMSSLMCFMEGSSSELPTSVEDAYKTMTLVEACYRSSENGGRIPVFEDKLQ
jgi:predicted dehydrogenase